MVAMTNGREVEKVGIAVAEEGPFNVRLHGPELLFQMEDLVILT